MKTQPKTKSTPPTAAQQTPLNSIENDVDDKGRLLLQALLEPMTPAALFEQTGIPRSSGYRHLERLVSQGLVIPEGEMVRISDAGKAVLTDHDFQEQPRPLELLWPWLRSLPTALHRAFLILALCTLSARRSNCVDDRHPGLILLGSTQLLKSWLCKILCILAGSTPERCRVPMQQVRQRGLVVRLDGKGEISYTSEQIAEPFLWLEEFSLAEPGVLRDVTALMQGVKAIRIENQQIEVAAVPLLEMNPVKNSDQLEDRLGLRPERIRRNFVANFSAVKVTRAMRASAGEVSKRLQDVGALSIPSAPLTPLEESSLGLIDDVVHNLVLPGMLDYVDPSRIQTAVLGARAWLSERDAVVEVLWCWCELAESTEYLIKNWRARLAQLLQPAKPRAETGAQAFLQSVPRPECRENVLNPLHGDRIMNRYRLDDVVVEFKELLNEAGLRLPEDAPKIKTFLSVIARLVKEGIAPTRLLYDPTQWVRLEKLQQFLDAQRLNTSNVEKLINTYNGDGFEVSRQRAGVFLLWAPMPVKKVPLGQRDLQLFDDLEICMLQALSSPESAINTVQQIRDCYCNLHGSHAELLDENAQLRAEIAQLRQPHTEQAPQKFTSTSEPNSRA